MNRLQFLLNLVAEECTEVGQRASKAIRFGLDEVQKGQELNNKERLHLELTDLIAVVLLLNQEYDFDFDLIHFDWSAIKAKHEKIEEFYEYSKQCGMIHEDDKSHSMVTKNFDDEYKYCEDKEYIALSKNYRANPSAFKTQYIDLGNSNSLGAVSTLNKMHRILEENGDTIL